MENRDGFTKQWHETHKIEEGGLFYFLKIYEPNSYEIKNEISWLMSSIIQKCENFDIPKLAEASVDDGFVKMEFIEEDVDKKTPEEIIDYLVACAVDIHSLLKADSPRLRNPVSKPEYKDFLKGYVKQRIDKINELDALIPPELINWIMSSIESLKVEYFTIVHRDLRARHLLFDSERKKPVLIDWEFSNISEPAQDLAKIIYDAASNGLDSKKIMKKVVDSYSNERKLSPEEIERRIAVFLPIIPLERSMSLVKRKPKGYEDELLKDLLFIQTLYEESH